MANNVRNNPEYNKKKKTKAVLIALFVILGLLLVILAAGAAMFFKLYSKSNYETVPSSVEILTEPEVLETMETLGETEAASIAEEIERAKEEILAEEEPGEETEAAETSEVYNLLLIGVDRRDASWNGNSDSMILCSVDYDAETVTLTSFMRDTAVNIPGAGVRKLNAAYALGAAPLLLQTLKANFNVDVDNYAWIDFNSMQSVISILGGVDISLTPTEASRLGYSIASDQVVHLDGEAALKYARDRFSGGYDYQRTQRQRNVIMAIVNKAKNGSLGDLTDAANAVLPYINHNLESTKLLSLMMDLPKIKDFTFNEMRVPIDGLYYSQNEFLIPDYAKTMEILMEVIH